MEVGATYRRVGEDRDIATGRFFSLGLEEDTRHEGDWRDGHFERVRGGGGVGFEIQDSLFGSGSGSRGAWAD
jgi:hypothetical protein